jgi:hypothetical protein
MKPALLILISASLLLLGCSLNDREILAKKWKYASGYRCKLDVIAFGGGFFRISHDTIFVLDSASAVITSRHKKWFSTDYIELKSLTTNETGKYSDFGKVNKTDTTYTIEIKQVDLVAPPIPPEPPPLPKK